MYFLGWPEAPYDLQRNRPECEADMRPAEWADGSTQVLVDVAEVMSVPHVVSSVLLVFKPAFSQL